MKRYMLDYKINLGIIHVTESEEIWTFQIALHYILLIEQTHLQLMTKVWYVHDNQYGNTNIVNEIERKMWKDVTIYYWGIAFLMLKH